MRVAPAPAHLFLEPSIAATIAQTYVRLPRTTHGALLRPPAHALPHGRNALAAETTGLPSSAPLTNE